MITIKAKREGDGISYECNMSGSGEDLANEAAAIFEQLPKQLEETNPAIFFRFLSEITASGKFGVAPHPDKKEEEAEANAE